MAKVTFKGNPVTLIGTEIKVGDKAPDFTVTAKDLSLKTLKDYEGKIKILSIFPSIDTGVCAMQTRTFNKKAGELAGNVTVLCISMDLPFAQNRFCAAEGIDHVVTLSDYRSADFGTKYGFLIEELHLLARGVVVLDDKNVVRYVEYVPEVGTEPNYDAAMEAIRKIAG